MSIFKLVSFLTRQLLMGICIFGLFLPCGACHTYLSEQIGVGESGA